MGAGKTTIGRLLAARRACTFTDLDALIVEKSGQPIPRMFAERGEVLFRALESELLAAWCMAGDGVLATGGGAVMLAANRRAMHRAGAVIWLHAEPEVTAGRIAGDANRPLIAGVDPLAKARQLAAARMPLYAEICDLRVDTGRCSVQESVDTIDAFLSESAHA